MTREEAIKSLTSLVEVRRKYCDMQTMSDEIDALDMAIKNLEQEPFMNKPCVARQVCHEDKVKILDKIRAEITDWQTDIHDNEYDAETHDFVFERIYEIIDKYKESEE